jgi:hypothetical protein
MDVLACAWQSFQHHTNRVIDRDETIFAVLGNTNVEQASHSVHVEPGEIENLSLSHSCVNRYRDDSRCPFLTFKFLFQEKPSLFEGQITCPASVSAKLPHSPTGIAVHQLCIKSQREDLGQHTKLAIHRCRSAGEEH